MKRTAAKAPERGDVVWITMSPQAGHEQAGRRPALVLSLAEYNRRVGLALVCPITSRAKGYPFEVELPAGLEVTGVVLADQVKSVDWKARQTVRICAAPAGVVTHVVNKLSALFE